MVQCLLTYWDWASCCALGHSQERLLACFPHLESEVTFLFLTSLIACQNSVRLVDTQCAFLAALKSFLFNSSAPVIRALILQVFAVCFEHNCSQSSQVGRHKLPQNLSQTVRFGICLVFGCLSPFCREFLELRITSVVRES